ncbi:fibronectin type III domain-containing protein [Aquimarina sp. 2201CG1-2-11]|uniref:fibronectin type III domain-containing protein n=1 Tax=Aquimarina discodermiae TaxID=3231043 RepID=UPI003461F855
MFLKFVTKKEQLTVFLLISFIFGIGINSYSMNKQLIHKEEKDNSFSKKKRIPAPWGLKASNIGTTSLKLSWENPENDIHIKEYVVYSKYGKLVTVKKGTNLVYLTKLKPSTNYGFRVYARDGYGRESVSSNEFSVSTLDEDIHPPSVPSGVRVLDISDCSVHLVWDTANDNIGIREYVILNEASHVVEYTTTNTSIIIDGLREATYYKFKIYSRDISGNYSAPSTPIEIKTIKKNDIYSPSIPFNLRVPHLSETSASLEWETSTDNVAVVSYKIFSNDNLIGTTSNNTFTIKELLPGSSYNIKVVAVDKAKNSSIPSNTVSIITCGEKDTEKPSTPIELQASDVTETSFKLSWKKSTDNAKVVKYEIFESGILLEETTDNFIYIDNLKASYTYNFSIKAIDTSENPSEVSKVLVVKTKGQPDVELPSVPQQLRAVNVTGDSLVLTWNTAKDNSGKVSYEVYNSEELIANISDTFIRISKKIMPYNLYVFKVYAVDSYRNRSSEPASIWVWTREIDDNVSPTKPLGFGVSNVTTNAASLSWLPSKDDVGVIEYAIYDQNGNFVIRTNNTNVTISNLSSNKTYSYKVFARDHVNNWSDSSDLVSFTTAKKDNEDYEIDRPSAPIGLKVVPIDLNNFQVSWEKGDSNEEVASYKIYNDLPFYDDGFIKSVNGDETTTDINFRSRGRSFTVKVYAVNRLGNISTPSNAFLVEFDDNIVVDNEKPSAPTDLKIVDVKEETFTLTWTASTDNQGISKYDVYINPGVGLVGSTTSTELEIDTSILAPGVEYQFLVKAFDTSNNSRISKVLKETIPGEKETEVPTTPKNLRLHNIENGNRVIIVWDKSTDNYIVNGYEVYINEELFPDNSAWPSRNLELKKNTQYKVYVRAVDISGNKSDKSNVITFTTSTEDTEKPSVPSGFKVVGTSNSSVFITWDNPKLEEGVRNHLILDENDKIIARTFNIFSISNSLNIKLPKETSSYNLRIVAVDMAGNRSEPSNAIIGELTCFEDNERPTTPKKLIGSKIVTTDYSIFLGLTREKIIVDLAWEASTDNVGVVRYQLSYGPEARTPGVFLQGTNAKFSIITGGINIKSFSIVAIDAAGNKSLPAIIYFDEPEEIKENIIEESKKAYNDDLVSRDNVVVYPNPATNLLYVDMKIPDYASYPYEIISLSGQKLLFGKLYNNESIHIDGLINGMYLLKIQTEKSVKIFSFLKK